MGLSGPGTLLTLACSRGGLAACGGGGARRPRRSSSRDETLSQADVQMLVEAAATAAPSDAMAIAVVDRLGRILAVYIGFFCTGLRCRETLARWCPSDELAVSLARTGAFFSNDQAPLSSRTVRFISGVHFPPAVANTASAALYGIENTNRGCNLAAS